MADLNFDLRPAQDLEQAEQEAANKLTQAESEDDERRAAIEAGTRQPLGPGERPFLDDARGRALLHAGNSTKIGGQMGTVIADQEASEIAGEALDKVDDEGDPLEKRFWNQWLAIVEPDANGRLLFYPNAARTDYGNPSFVRNRAWWDRAAVNFRNESLSLPPQVVTFKEEILSMADRYGTALDRSTAADQKLLTDWKELVELSKNSRKTRRKTRRYLNEDFDGQSRWVDELVAPPAKTVRKPNPPEGGTTPT